MEAMGSNFDGLNDAFLEDKLFRFVIRCLIDVDNLLNTNGLMRVLNENRRLNLDSAFESKRDGGILKY